MIEELEQMKDPITGGMGRSVFFDQAKEILTQHATQYCVISMDVREFKLINVSFGRDAGNRLLEHIHRSIEDELSGEELVVRDAGDIFYAIVKLRDHQQIVSRIEKIRRRIDEGQLINNDISPYIALRYGVYLPVNNSEKFETMLEYANMARKHTHCVVNCAEECFYDPKRAQGRIEERQKIAELLQAFEHDQFEVYLQPKVSLKRGVIEGAEALVRWQHPQRGLCMPGSFIPLLEKYRLIHRLDLLIFKKVCEILSTWTVEQRQRCPVSVNLSRLSLEIPDLPQILKHLADEANIKPEEMELEITETAFVQDFKNIKEVINELRKEGFRCSIDDFGFGYSSLICLSELSVDAVKLSRSFFIKETEKAQLVIESILQLATALGFKTVAEGIETQEQLQRLRGTNCDLVQGFVHYQPMPVQRFEQAVFR